MVKAIRKLTVFFIHSALVNSFNKLFKLNFIEEFPKTAQIVTDLKYLHFIDEKSLLDYPS